MQLVLKDGAVHAHYADDATVPLDQFPGAEVVFYSGELESLPRVGPPPQAGMFDSRPRAAPTISLGDYAVSAYAALLAKGIRVDVAEDGAPKKLVLVDGTRDTRADVTLLARYGEANPAGTRTWIDNEGVATELTGVELVRLGDRQGAWISTLVPAYAAIEQALAASPPRMKKTAQIDAALAAAAKG